MSSAVIDGLSFAEQVNLFKCTDELTAGVKAAASASGATPASVLQGYIDAAEAMLVADVAANKAIGRFGADAVKQHRAAKTSGAGAAAAAAAGEKCVVMTICNTG